MPRSEARKARATGCPFFGPAEEDEGVLVVVNLAFCSLSGHQFRGKGIGTAMVNMMITWAREKGWRAIEVYGTTGGLFPWDWLDACIPPRPFWEHRGFTVFKQRPHRYTDEELDNLLADNPRNSESEQEEKQRTIAQIRAGRVGESSMGSFDLRRVL
jgi:predicted GNAT family acetyltransferase